MREQTRMHQQADQDRARRKVSGSAISVAIVALGVTPAYGETAKAEALFNYADDLFGVTAIAAIGAGVLAILPSTNGIAVLGTH